MAIRIGALNRRIELQAPQRTPDGAGGFATAYVTKATVWASIQPLRGDELVQAMQLSATVTTKIIIRYQHNIKPQWKVKYGSRLFNIVSIISPEEDKRTIEIMCKESN